MLSMFPMLSMFSMMSMVLAMWLIHPLVFFDFSDIVDGTVLGIVSSSRPSTPRQECPFVLFSSGAAGMQSHGLRGGLKKGLSGELRTAHFKRRSRLVPLRPAVRPRRPDPAMGRYGKTLSLGL